MSVCVGQLKKKPTYVYFDPCVEKSELIWEKRGGGGGGGERIAETSLKNVHCQENVIN